MEENFELKTKILHIDYNYMNIFIDKFKYCSIQMAL
jgi:hypothetical protein